MTEQQRMLSGQLYISSDPELLSLRRHARQVTYQFNTLPPGESAQGMALLKGLFAALGPNSFIEPTFR